MLLALGCGAPRGSEQAPREVLVFAAASLQDVLRELVEAIEHESGISVVVNFAGSNVLAQQIRAAPLADLFLSADTRWLDVLESEGLLVRGSRIPLLANRLVIVANEASELQLPDPRSLPALDFRHLSMGDPEAVPAGRYARSYLASLELDDEGGSVWRQVADRVVPAPDVRAALALVAAEADALGVVYRTDARTSENVRVLYEVNETLEPPIRYGMAWVKKGGPPAPEVGKVAAFLLGERARGVFERHGFVVLP